MFEKVMPALANDFAKYALVDRPTQLGKRLKHKLADMITCRRTTHTVPW